MIELPLFPVDVVLFPMQSLQFHIFEDHYKQMIRECMERKMPFGIIPLNAAAGSMPALIGCTAHIENVDNLSQGRMNIVVVGRDRFYIREFLGNRPYPVGLVEEYPLSRSGMDVPTETLKGLRACIRRYIGLLEKGCRIQPKQREMPQDPLLLLGLAASVLHDVPLVERQQVLEMDDLPLALAAMRRLYRLEIVLAEARPFADARGRHLPSSFSIN